MSDLIFFFGNNDDDLLSIKSKDTYPKNYDINENKKIQRPTTLRTRKESSSTKFLHKQLRSPDCNNGSLLKHLSKFPLTPANVSVKIIDKFFNAAIPLHSSLSCSSLSHFPSELPPENADGNIEYKRQLLNLTPLRLQHLITQLKWRLAEGDGEAIYEIGVDDDGKVTGLEKQELLESVTNLCKMAESLNASVSVLRECQIGSRRALEILIRKLPTYFSTHEIRVALLGNMGAGKSTLIGVLTQGVLDNGQGKTRMATFRHMHEVRSGRTSSISCQMLGFDTDQNVCNFYRQNNCVYQRSHEEVVLSSSKLVSLIDLAGYHKYQRTTLFALTARRPHHVLLVIPANYGFRETSIDHCQFAMTLGVSIAVVVTKIDRYSPDEAIGQFSDWLKTRFTQLSISIVSSIASAKRAALDLTLNKRIPIFCVSCVNGSGVDILTTFLGTLQTTVEISKQHKTEIWIDQILYEVPRVDGCIVGGLVSAGVVNEGDCLYLGPQKDGNFISVTIQSIHRNRVQQTTVEHGKYASFAVSLTDSFLTQKDNATSCNGLKWVPQSLSSPDDDTQNCVHRGMVLLGNCPDSHGNYLFKHLTEENSSHGHIVWGVVVNNIRELSDQKWSINDLQKQQGSWIVHCGNVYQKCEIWNRDKFAKGFQSSELIQEVLAEDLIFYFKLFPQFIHGNYPVVFHRTGQLKCGTIKLLLGRDAFKRMESSENHIKKISDCHNSFSRIVSENYFTDIEAKKKTDDDSSDEYITAPSSPILF